MNSQNKRERERIAIDKATDTMGKNHINIYCSHGEINQHEKANETSVKSMINALN